MIKSLCFSSHCSLAYVSVGPAHTLCSAVIVTLRLTLMTVGLHSRKSILMTSCCLLRLHIVFNQQNKHKRSGSCYFVSDIFCKGRRNLRLFVFIMNLKESWERYVRRLRRRKMVKLCNYCFPKKANNFLKGIF